AAYKEGRLPLLVSRFDTLQRTLDAALRLDTAARSVDVALLPDGDRPRAAPARPTGDVEKAMAEAESALRQVAALGPHEIPDAAARRVLVSAVVPVETRLALAGELKPGGALKGTLVVSNQGETAVAATVDPILPPGWVASPTPKSAIGPGKQATIDFTVRLP